MFTRCGLVVLALALTTGSHDAQEKKPTTTKEPIYAEKPISAWINDLKFKNLGPDARPKALAVLSRLGPRDEAAIPCLVEALKFEKVTPAACCMPGMMGMGRRAEPESRIDTGVSQPAAHALARIGPASVPALVAALREHPDPSGAVAALGRVGPQAAPVLVELLNRDKDARVRRLAAQALGQLGEEGVAGLSALIKALDDPDAHLQASATEALALIGAPAKDAVPVFLERLKHKDPSIRSAAATALAKSCRREDRRAGGWTGQSRTVSGRDQRPAPPRRRLAPWPNWSRLGSPICSRIRIPKFEIVRSRLCPRSDPKRKPPYLR